LVVVSAADHFFAGKLSQLDEAIRAWVKRRHPKLVAAAESRPTLPG
jgi:alpha/beta superfamily hydrolase